MHPLGAPLPLPLRTQALPLEALQALAQLPTKQQARAKACEALVALVSNGLFTEVDTGQGRGYALCVSKESLADQVGMSTERLTHALAVLTEIGLLVKTAGHFYGAHNGSSPDRYWLTTLPGFHVPAPNPRRTAPPQNPRVSEVPRDSQPPQNPRVKPVITAPVSPNASVQAEDLVVCSSITTEKENNNKVVELSDHRSPRYHDGTAITDLEVLELLKRAGFTRELPLPVSEALLTNPDGMRSYLVTILADPLIRNHAGYVRTALSRGHVPQHAPSVQDEDFHSPWCGECDPHTRRKRMSGSEILIRCVNCHDGLKEPAHVNA